MSQRLATDETLMAGLRRDLAGMGTKMASLTDSVEQQIADVRTTLEAQVASERKARKKAEKRLTLAEIFGGVAFAALAGLTGKLWLNRRQVAKTAAEPQTGSDATTQERTEPTFGPSANTIGPKTNTSMAEQSETNSTEVSGSDGKAAVGDPLDLADADHDRKVALWLAEGGSTVSIVPAAPPILATAATLSVEPTVVLSVMPITESVVAPRTSANPGATIAAQTPSEESIDLDDLLGETDAGQAENADKASRVPAQALLVDGAKDVIRSEIMAESPAATSTKSLWTVLRQAKAEVTKHNKGSANNLAAKLDELKTVTITALQTGNVVEASKAARYAHHHTKDIALLEAMFAEQANIVAADKAHGVRMLKYIAEKAVEGSPLKADAMQRLDALTPSKTARAAKQSRVLAA